MKTVISRALAILVTVSVLIMLIGHSELAGAVLQQQSGSIIDQVSFVRGDTLVRTNSVTFVDVPRAVTTVSVPTGQRGVILARFSGSTSCHARTARITGSCAVRILINAAEAEPAVGLNFAFDSTTPGQETSVSMESHSMDRALTVGPGTYTVKAQWATTSPNIEFQRGAWSLTVQKVRTN